VELFVHLLSLQVPLAGSGSFTSARTLPLDLLIFFVLGEEFLSCGGGTTILHSHGESQEGSRITTWFVLYSVVALCLLC
jgi:hypothetical protein